MSPAGTTVAGSRREQLIAHAADLLRESGPAALTTVAVAKRLGVTQPAVYRHVNDVHELMELAAAAVADSLVASLHLVILDDQVDWEDISDVDVLCRQVVRLVVDNEESLQVVAHWRFAEGPLGDGIRRVVDESCSFIEELFESRWRIEFAGDHEMSDAERTALGFHARATYDDAIAVIQLAFSPTLAPLDLDDVSTILKHRIIAGWAAFVIDLNERAGLPYPRIDLELGIVPD